MTDNKKIYGHYEVEETFKEDGSWSGYLCRTLDAKGNTYGFIAKTDIKIKRDPNKDLTP